MERCPNCRARDRGEAHCHRCGMALARLREIEARARHWEQVAVRRLAQGDRAGAQQAAAAALGWQRRPLARALYGLTRGEGRG